MKGLRYSLSFIIICLSAICDAQDLKSKTLLTIDGNEYDAGTFMRVYLKNLDIVQDESQKNLDNYLELYIDYKLKVMQAHELGLHNDESYQKELKSYRSSLSESFLTDNEVTDALVKEAYERMNNEVNASHILIKVSRGATPEDTLEAYNKAQNLKDRIDAGEDFAVIARNHSEGPSAVSNGDLGWFGPFKMVFEFETAAYENEVGTVSDIFRTDFGYHLLKVNGTRPTPGEVMVAHIMTYDQRQDSTINSKQRIDEIYKQLESGRDFAAMAREFSEDINSARNGGKLPRFGTGGLNAPEFEQTAFEMEVGSYSQPVKTKFGWHIIHLIERYSQPTFEESKENLKNQIKKSARSRKITESFTNKLIDKYRVKLPVINSFRERFPEVTDSLMTKSWDNLTLSSQIKPLFTIRDRKLDNSQFYEFITQKQKKDFKEYANLEEKLKFYYKEFVDKSLIQYYDDHLEQDNEDFAFIYREYKEGLLLFELMEKKVWQAAKIDTAGQLAYYEKHKNNYQWKRRIDIDLTQNTTKDAALQVQQLLKEGTSIEEIKNQLNDKEISKVMVSSGVVEEGYSRLPQGFKIQKGVSSIYEKEDNGFYKVIHVKEVIEPGVKTFEEARGAVINDYQQQLEKEWLENLKKDRSIKVDDKVFDRVKKEIEKKRRA